MLGSALGVGGDFTRTFDPAGNVLADGVREMTWNARGELATVAGPVAASFSYDPLGRRVAKTVDGSTTSYLYDRDDIARMTPPSGGPVDFLDGLAVDEHIARTDAGGTAVYLRDSLGSILGIVGADGTVGTRFSYDPFGATLVQGNADPTPFGFTGRERDETGLYYFRARYYHPYAARFVSEDPLGYAAGDANVYTYVGNSPTNATDPSGLCGVDAIVDVGFLLWDGWTLIRDGRKNLTENLLAGGADLAGLAIPCATGGGAAVHGAAAADDVIDATRGLDNAADAANAADEASDAGHLADDIADMACSFSGDTEVLMADGTRKPIADIDVGDEVLATDPESGETRAREVLATLPHTDQLLTLRTSSGEIVTTDDHRYWNVTDGEWQESQDLDQGDRLLTHDGDAVVVEGLDWSTLHTAPAYDLDIADLDTYYVGARDENVLVHNCNVPWINADELPAAERAALDDTVSHIDAGTLPSGPTSNRWGVPFNNREGYLPAGSYTEYRVAPPPGTSGPGPLRVVVENDTGAMYYTWTHYGDAGSPAFVRIR